MVAEPVTLYGLPHSLYTGRVRSYFIKAGIAYREVAPDTDHYRDRVVARAGGRAGLPTVELADGTVIRDGAAILDHFEAASGEAFSPATPKQGLVSRLFDVIGAEGLLRPAMHYRWNFDDENRDFLDFHFRMAFGDDADAARKAGKSADRMRKATHGFGVNPETAELVETVYADQLRALDRHFAVYPYLLGARPSIGDFGMIAPLFGHLGRDPHPLRLMQTRAHHVFRWVERMNRLDGDVCEFAGPGETELADDEIPETLIDVLRAMAEDFVPETLAAAAQVNRWLDEHDDLAPGSEAERGAGFARFEIRGTQISALAQPYRFYLLQRVQAAYAAMTGETRSATDDMLAACDMSPILSATLTRGIGRRNNLEVWL